MTNRARDWEPVQDSIHEMVRRIAAQFHPDKIILFGSHARGDARPDSDIDLLAKMGWGRILNRAWGRTIGAILPFNTSVDVMFETSILMTPRLGRFPMWRFGHPTV